MPRVSFGSIGVDPFTGQQAMARVGELVEDGGGTVFTPNVHHVALAERDPIFAAAYRSAALCLCDGTPLRWAAGLQAPIPERIAGSAFLPRLLEVAAQRRWRVAFVGGRQEVAERLPALVQGRYPGLRLAWLSEPTRRLVRQSPEQWHAVLDALRAAKAQLICVSLPSPLQEIWARNAYAALGQAVFVCTGSAVDRLVGAAAVPPPWLGATGLEWLWRVGQEPKRLGPRYAADLRVFVPLLARAILRWRWRG